MELALAVLCSFWPKHKACRIVLKDWMPSEDLCIIRAVQINEQYSKSGPMYRLLQTQAHVCCRAGHMQDMLRELSSEENACVHV